MRRINAFKHCEQAFARQRRRSGHFISTRECRCTTSLAQRSKLKNQPEIGVRQAGARFAPLFRTVSHRCLLSSICVAIPQ